MNLKRRHLEVLVALIEAGSISRAAEQLGLSQPAVSIALSTLEAELGFRLFHRTRGYFAPTSEAQTLYAEAELGLLAISRIERRARELRGGKTGGVVIASNGVAAFNLLPRLIADFQRDHPDVTVDLRIRSSLKIASWVAGGQADIGLVDAPVAVSGVHAEIFPLPCVCIFPEGHPLAALRVVGPADLDGLTVIAITGDHTIDRALDRLATGAGARLRRLVSGSYFAIMRNLVAAGAGVALIDSLNGRMALPDGVAWRPFAPRIDFEFAMIAHESREMSRAARGFADRLRAAIRDGAGAAEAA